MDRLTNFLIMLVVFELTHGPFNGAWGVVQPDKFRELVAPLSAIHIGQATWPTDNRVSVFLGTDIAIFAAHERDGSQSVQLAARTAHALQPLKSLTNWDSWDCDDA